MKYFFLLIIFIIYGKDLELIEKKCEEISEESLKMKRDNSDLRENEKRLNARNDILSKEIGDLKLSNEGLDKERKEWKSGFKQMEEKAKNLVLERDCLERELKQQFTMQKDKDTERYDV